MHNDVIESEMDQMAVANFHVDRARKLDCSRRFEVA